VLTWVNRHARQAGVTPGLQYATALALAPWLRAEVVSPHDIIESVEFLAAWLRRFSPGVEASTAKPGLFWLNADGLVPLYSSMHCWAAAVRADLLGAGFRATVAVGFSRFGTAAAAQVGTEVSVFSNCTQEQAAAQRVPLVRLGCDPVTCDELNKLGIVTLGELLSLPTAGLVERFGDEVRRLHQQATDLGWNPLQPDIPREPIQYRLELDASETELTRLLFLIKRGLHAMLAKLATQGRALVELQLELMLADGGPRLERLRTAAPTLDALCIIDLVRVRLQTLVLSAGVSGITLTAQSVPATDAQLRLFQTQERRDLAAANRALARLRAEFGDTAVSHARLREGHLPEAQFTWESVEQVLAPHPRSVAVRLLVRRIISFPRALPSPPRERYGADWMPGGPAAGSVVRLVGPDVIAGGWWNTLIQREYYCAETQRGDLLWIFYDRRRRRWFLYGRID
jgi:protein ImuB